MLRRSLILALVLLVGVLSRLGAQSAGVATPAAEPSLAGARLGPVPDLLYAHLPALPRGQGAVVEDMQPGSVLERAGIRKYDILVSCAGNPIRDAGQLARLLGSPTPGEPKLFVLIRAGRQLTLALETSPDGMVQVPKGLIKAGGPPAVSVEAQPLDGGKLRVVFVYYSDGTGKLERVTCSGSLGEIEAEVRQLGRDNRMSTRVQDLVDVALKRIREVNASASP